MTKIALLLLCVASLTQAQEHTSKGQWKHQSELGIVVTGGNSESETINVAQTTSYAWDKHTVKSTGHYLTSSSGEVRTAENWSAGLRYDRKFSDLSAVFAGNLWQGDRFAGFRYRNNWDLGYQHYFRKNDKGYLLGEIGYRFTYEEKSQEGLEPTRNHFARFFGDTLHKFNQHVSGRFWLEVLPDFNDSDNMNINFEPSLMAALSNVFSVKLAFLYRYDTVPAIAGNEKYDYNFIVSLIAQF